MRDGNPDQKVVTALDIIEQQAALEKEAQEVLPGKFEKCTYEQGYIRQNLYACKTCTSSEDEPAGMCYSCSIACHSDHELLELFPKRNFRCDCGLPGKFGGHPCELASRQKRDAPPNDKNQYNHNFRGYYCRCDEFYDPEKEDGTMFQCVLCEDWFHDHCIGEMPESIADFESYICRTCTGKYPFLVQNADKHRSIGLCRANDKIHEWIIAQPSTATTITKEDNDNQNTKENNDGTEANGNKRKLDDDASSENSNKRAKFDDTQTTTQTRKCVNAYIIPNDCAAEMFLNEGWRSKLCRCGECVEELKANSLEFLCQEENTFEPEEDEDAGKSLLDVGMEHLMRMDRVKAIESARAYNRLSEQIRDFLQGFKDSGQVVTEKDIKQFFAQKRLELEAQSH